MVTLYPYQLDALDKMKNGCILNGGVGSGKSLTSIAYYYLRNGGNKSSLTGGKFTSLKNPKELYIITTARKRDTHEWDGELQPFGITAIVDSWNNIVKYKDVTNAFFIFDEQRVVGYGAWSKAFIRIAKKNEWILLSATPGDTWSDYIPVFIANGFYRNKSHFVCEHIVYSPRVKFPKVERYLNTGKLIKLRRQILVDMDFHRKTIRHDEYIYTEYDKKTYSDIRKKRWNPWKDQPIENASELCYALRKVVNGDESRAKAIKRIASGHPHIIIFYNFNYELDILKAIEYPDKTEIAEWNGHVHQSIPNCKRWVYLVQYTSGCEGWNCTLTDTTVFYSWNYSYKVMEQASGRIDRLNTPYKDLYYYHLSSHSDIDMSIKQAVENKRNFNIGKFAGSQ